MSDKLKPCPFCGGKAIIDGCDDTLWITICKKCNASIGYKETKQDAIDAWNRRIEPTFTPDEIDIIARYMRQDFDGNGALERAILKKCNAALKGWVKNEKY